MAQNHAMPREVERVAKGQYKVRGTELSIEQGTDDKWRVHGHSEDLGAFGSRGQALAKLQEKGLVPEVPAEQPKPEPESAVDLKAKIDAKKAEPKEQPKRRPRTRKQPAKAVAKV